jgi:hypothetical protein
VRAEPTGPPSSVTIVWRGRCTDPVGHFRTKTNAGSPPATADGRFASRGSYSFRDGRYRIAVVASLHGRRLSPYRFRGTFGASATVRRGGRVIDRCRLRTSRWYAKVPAVRIQMTSEGGSYIVPAGSYDYRTPDLPVTGSGTRKVMFFSAEGYSFDFSAPRGRTLRPGRFAGATRYPFSISDGVPGIDVHGNGRGCNTVTGEFTVQSSRFDRRGKLISARLTFEHHCEGGPAAIRGTINFHR